ncbi:uncharacterized protein LOC119726089 [Patiria miniata]|uniref:Uncharacterized protein n=1 Tax=Patiria miniata TaxID=46514 RepID=A0A913ZPC2_PATMI|nr:uncharacterized protein LOC119726089 [Patiria miniata]
MTRWILALLLCACLAVALADDAEFKDGAIVIDDEVCEKLAAQVKSEKSILGVGPKHWYCNPTLERKKEQYCTCSVVPRERDADRAEFLEPEEAGGFLNRSKRDLNHECCDEGCVWEEVEEHCH